MFGNKEDRRFETIHSEGGLEVHKILRDKKTGVNYLFVFNGSAGGLTVLLDSTGEPVVTIDETSYK